MHSIPDLVRAYHVELALRSAAVTFIVGVPLVSHTRRRARTGRGQGATAAVVPPLTGVLGAVLDQQIRGAPYAYFGWLTLPAAIGAVLTTRSDRNGSATPTLGAPEGMRVIAALITATGWWTTLPDTEIPVSLLICVATTGALWRIGDVPRSEWPRGWTGSARWIVLSAPAVVLSSAGHVGAALLAGTGALGLAPALAAGGRRNATGSTAAGILIVHTALVAASARVLRFRAVTPQLVIAVVAAIAVANLLTFATGTAGSRHG